MESFDRKLHWEKIYGTKEFNEVSWYQSVPKTSLKLISELGIALDAKIVDIGGGDSLLVDFLLEKGFSDLTVLDISEIAIEKAKKRLGIRAQKIKWIDSDITEFESTEKYDFWHDRAAFHFLTEKNQTDTYVKLANDSIKTGGKMLIGTFSVDGPQKCSGIEIAQYSEESMTVKFQPYFQKIKCEYADHFTPFESVQKFVFCSFEKK